MAQPLKETAQLIEEKCTILSKPFSKGRKRSLDKDCNQTKNEIIFIVIIEMKSLLMVQKGTTMPNTAEGKNTHETLNVVFDIGNVLLRWDPPNLYRQLFEGDEEKVAYFLTHICSHEWNLEQDRGRSWEDATELLVSQFPEWENPIRAYYDRWWDMLTGPIDVNGKILEELSDKKHPVYAITNFSAHALRECQAKYPFLNRFEGMIISSDEELVKPDRDIFDVFFARYNLKPENCVFIDDSLPNIETADQLGMKTIHFLLGKTDLRNELKKLGVPV